MDSKMKRHIFMFCFLLILALIPFISEPAAAFEEAVASFVLTEEGGDQMISRLEAAGCTNLYQALVYLRNDLVKDPGAPSHLTTQMDTLIASIEANGGGEVFTASLHDFAGHGNSPVGINGDGTFIRADFSIYTYDGHTGYSRHTIDGADTAIGAELYTYSNNSSDDLYMGSSEIDLGGGITKTVNYKAFAVAWSVTPTLTVSSSTLTVGAAADSSASFNISSNLNWVVSSSESWLAVNPASGTGNGSVTVTAEKNPGLMARSATISVSATGISPQTLTITQSAGDLDSCPDDSSKSEPGVCGCGLADTDANNDGVIDCLVDPGSLACGEQASSTLRTVLIGDNKALADIAVNAATKIDRLVKQFQKKFGKKAIKSLSQFVVSSKRSIAKAQANTDSLIVSLPVILNSCSGSTSPGEISNIEEKNLMLTNTKSLQKSALRIVARLAFLQVSKDPRRSEASASASERKRIKAAQKATNAEIELVYKRLLLLISKVPDTSA